MTKNPRKIWKAAITNYQDKLLQFGYFKPSFYKGLDVTFKCLGLAC